MNKTIFIIALSIIAFTTPLSAKQDSLDLVTLKKEVADLQKQQKAIDWGTILPVSAIALGALWLAYGLFQSKVKSVEERMLKQFETRLDDQITKTINDKKNIIDRTIGNTDIELRLMQTKRMFRIGEVDDAIVKKVLKNVGFNMQNYYTSEEEASKGFDVLFINDKGGSIEIGDTNTKLIQEIKSLPEDVVVFYYNNTGKRLDTGKFPGMEDKISFVNAASQIYGNLLNTLKYQDKISKKYN